MPENLAMRQIKIKGITRDYTTIAEKKKNLLFCFTSEFSAKELGDFCAKNPGFCLLKGYVGGSVSP